MHTTPQPPGPGQESVWSYPRPPSAEPVHRRAVITLAGTVVVDTADLVRVCETSHPPTYYLPRAAFTPGVLVPGARRTRCEWKGVARYVDVVVPGARRSDAGWWYPEPDRRYPELTDRVALYPALFDQVRLDGVIVTPQPGGFYGGWITPEVVGPFKGEPGTSWW
jgi:uncharacterized protein (DUF427 family)